MYYIIYNINLYICTYLFSYNFFINIITLLLLEKNLGIVYCEAPGIIKYFETF